MSKLDSFLVKIPKNSPILFDKVSIEFKSPKLYDIKRSSAYIEGVGKITDHQIGYIVDTGDQYLVIPLQSEFLYQFSQFGYASPEELREAKHVDVLNLPRSHYQIFTPAGTYKFKEIDSEIIVKNTDTTMLTVFQDELYLHYFYHPT